MQPIALEFAIERDRTTWVMPWVELSLRQISSQNQWRRCRRRCQGSSGLNRALRERLAVECESYRFFCCKSARVPTSIGSSNGLWAQEPRDVRVAQQSSHWLRINREVFDGDGR